MRKFLPAFSFIALALSVSQCYKEPDFGHLKLYVTFPEAVVVPDEPVYFVPSPGEGASVNLFDKDAVCLGYKDARAGIAWLDDNYSGPKYSLGTDEHGMAVFENLMPGEYLLVVCTMKLYRYSERYIEVGGGDTLKLTKNFTPDLGYIDQLEPWDHQIPGYEY